MWWRPKSVVGLDIGSSAVKAVELRPAAKTFRVAACGSELLPPDSIVDGTIIDKEAVAGAVRRVFDSAGIKTRDVVASLSGHAVIVKKISVPWMSRAELAEAIYWEAEQYIPYDVQDVNIDYQIVDGADPTEGRGTMDVLLVAAKKDKIAEYTNLIAQVGRRPVILDVDTFALQNAYEVNYGFEPGTVVVLMNAGASAVNLNILHGNQSVFTRDISLGGNAYTEALQRELNLSVEAADGLKRGGLVDGVSFEDAIPVLRAVTENLLMEIHKTFEFARATTATDRFDRIVLSGGTSRLEGFAEMLAEQFGLPVEPFDPFRQIGFDSSKLRSLSREDVAPTAAVAVGLALRRVGDR